MRIAFILDHPLKLYRIPFFKLLASKYKNEIVVFHSGVKQAQEKLYFEECIVKRKSIMCVFDYRKGINLDNFDVVVCMQNLRLLNLWQLSLKRNRSFKLIHWGIGVSSSNGLSSQSYFIKSTRNWIMNYADAIVFYSYYPLKFIKKSLQEKCFVALNTIENTLSEDLSSSKKDSFIFIGSLDKRKGLRETIISFHKYLSQNPINIRKLIIIGEGVEYEFISHYVSSNHLEGSIILVGRLDNPIDKKEYFKRSIACISLNQAGLSVLESFSFGVPFVTKANAISGGEHLNIKNNLNGFLVNDLDEFINKLNWFDQSMEKAKKLGENAFSYFKEKANMDQMVDSFEKAFNYIIS